MKFDSSLTVRDKEREQLYASLNDLNEKAWNSLEEGAYRLQDVQILAEYVSQVRALLRDWEKAESVRGCPDRRTSRISEMHARYQQLEGMIKETRNDLQRTVKNGAEKKV